MQALSSCSPPEWQPPPSIGSLAKLVRSSMRTMLWPGGPFIMADEMICGMYSGSSLQGAGAYRGEIIQCVGSQACVGSQSRVLQGRGAR